MKIPLIPTFCRLLNQTLYLLIYDQTVVGNKVKQKKIKLKNHYTSSFLLLSYTHSLSKTWAQGIWNPFLQASPKPACLTQEGNSYCILHRNTSCLTLLWADFLVQKAKLEAIYLWWVWCKGHKKVGEKTHCEAISNITVSFQRSSTIAQYYTLLNNRRSQSCRITMRSWEENTHILQRVVSAWYFPYPSTIQTIILWGK